MGSQFQLGPQSASVIDDNYHDFDDNASGKDLGQIPFFTLRINSTLLHTLVAPTNFSPMHTAAYVATRRGFNYDVHKKFNFLNLSFLGLFISTLQSINLYRTTDSDL